MLPSLTQSGIKANTIVHYSRCIIIYTMMIPIMTSHVVCIQFESNERRRNIGVFISGTCMQEQFDDTKGVTRRRQSNKDRTCHGQKKKEKRTTNDLKKHYTEHTRIPLIIVSELECSGKGMQLLLVMLHLSCYSCYKRSDSITVNQFKCKEMLLIIIA